MVEYSRVQIFAVHILFATPYKEYREWGAAASP
jgi:hypothetical protein